MLELEIGRSMVGSLVLYSALLLRVSRRREKTRFVLERGVALLPGVCLVNWRAGKFLECSE